MTGCHNDTQHKIQFPIINGCVTFETTYDRNVYGILMISHTSCKMTMALMIPYRRYRDLTVNFCNA